MQFFHNSDKKFWTGCIAALWTHQKWQKRTGKNTKEENDPFETLKKTLWPEHVLAYPTSDWTSGGHRNWHSQKTWRS
jgi:hypothetical protein